VVFNTSFFPRAKTSILTTLDRITAPVTDFIRGNPIVSTAAVGIGTTGLITGIAAVTRVRRKRKKAKASKKKRRSSRKTRKKRVGRPKRVKRSKKRRTHSSPRHKGHKKVSFTTAGGKRVSFLVKKKRRKHHK